MNANTYANIQQSEFENALAALGDFEQVELAGTKELVYHVETGVENFAIRVYSSLARDGSARDAGADAIRTVLWNTLYDRPVESSTRTNRIQTWEKNLAKKVLALRVRAEEEADEGDENAEAYDSLPAATGASDEIVVADVVSSRYGKKAALDSPFSAKDDIKALSWDDTHRAWDADRKQWTVDADALATVVAALADAGWTVAKPAAEEEEDDEMTVADEIAGIAETARPGDEVVVTYVSKTSKREMEKSGEVRRTRAGRVDFVRSDGQGMHVTKDGLFTSMSAFPFVGEVVGIEFTPSAGADRKW